MKELAKAVGFFIAIGGILIVASIIYDIFNQTLVACFMFLMILFPVLFMYVGVIREGLFYKESDIGYFLLHIISSVVSGVSVVTLINLFMIKTQGVKFIYNLIEHDVFASDGYQGFLSWIRSCSRYKKASPIAKIFDFNRSFKWFADVMPKPDTIAFTVVMIIAFVLAVLGIVLTAIAIRRVYLIIPSYFLFTPVLLLLLTMICNMAASIAIAVVPVILLMLLAAFFIGSSSGTVFVPSGTRGKSEYMHRYGDVGETNYHIENSGDNYKVVRDEQGNQKTVYQDPTNSDRYRDDDGNVYHFK